MKEPSPMSSPMIDELALALARRLISVCTEKHLTVGSVESCTGGLISAVVTAIDGASAVFVGGIATYSNDVKLRLADVREATIIEFGAVSAQTAIAMAQGGRIRLRTDLCVSVTGIAGPQGGNVKKPVGLVHFAVASPSQTIHEKQYFGAVGRDEVRLKSVHKALAMLIVAASRLQSW